MPRVNDDAHVLERFGSHLRQLRLERHITQEELASMAGFSRSYYTEVETGKRNISLLNLHKLAVSLGVSLSELLQLE